MENSAEFRIWVFRYLGGMYGGMIRQAFGLHHNVEMALDTAGPLGGWSITSDEGVFLRAYRERVCAWLDSGRYAANLAPDAVVSWRELFEYVDTGTFAVQLTMFEVQNG